MAREPGIHPTRVRWTQRDRPPHPIKSGEVDRYAGDTWYEIVGVVKNFGWQLPEPWEQSAMYR